MSLVIDSSVTLAWVYSDETTATVREVFQTVGKAGAWVPAIWRLEVANVLEMGVRRKRHSGDFSNETLADLSLLPIEVDRETDQQAWKRNDPACHSPSTHDS